MTTAAVAEEMAAAVIRLPSIPTVTMGASTVRGAPAAPRMSALGGNRGGQGGQGGQGGGRGGFFGQPSPEADALQKAIDDDAPAGQIKDLLAKYKVSQKAKQAKLVAAQSDLRAVLTVKQEASATLMGLLD